MMQINPENRNLQGMTSFLAFVALNIVFLITCLPVITIGAATSALYEVTIRYSDDESGRPLKDYFPAFGRNFARATLLWLALLVPFAMLLAGAAFWAGSTSVLGGAAMLLAILAAAYLFAVFLYAMALTAMYRNTFRQTMRNALLLPAAEPVRSIGIVLVPATLICLTGIMPMFGVVLGTVGFSVGAYATAFLFRSVFRRHTPGA